jgi:hypothetical protein
MLEFKIKLLRSNVLAGLAAAPDPSRHDGCSAGLGARGRAIWTVLNGFLV